VRAVESQAFKTALHINPQFYREWPLQERWRLLYGLDTSLLDYSGVLDLSAVNLILPFKYGDISYRHLAQALQEVDFELDLLDWDEELRGVQTMTTHQLGGCHEALRSDQASATVNELIDCGIAFISRSDDYPILDELVGQKTLAQVVMGLTARLGLLPKARKVLQFENRNGAAKP
jgi:hypothetical protein